MFFKRKKLLNRLLVITLGTTVFPLFLVGIYLIPKTEHEIQEVTRQQLYSHANLFTNSLQQQLFLPLNFFLKNLAISENFLSQSQFNSILSDYPSLHAYLREVIYFSPAFANGEKHWFSVDTSQTASTAYLQEFTAKVRGDSSITVYGQVVNSADHREVLLVGMQGASSSVFVVTIDLVKFLTEFENSVRLLNLVGAFEIYDKTSGQLLFDLSFTEKQKQSPATQLLSAKNQRPNSPYYQYQNADNGEFIGAYLDLVDLVDWRIVAELPQHHVRIPLTNIWINFGVLLIFGIILSLLGTTYYLKRITGPLDRFARSATEIARGDFTQKIHLDSDDEIGRLARIFNYMVIELRRLNEMNLNKIITERTKTKTIIKNIGDGVIVTDQLDRVVTINVAVERWFHILEQDVIEKPIAEVIQIRDLLLLIEEIKETELEGTFTRELQINLPDQTKGKVFQARATRIFSQEEKFLGVVTILRDITQEKEIDRMKTELVSLVAHELRSPLTSISGFAELLLSPNENAENIHEYATVIREETSRLADLVNKFLDITKIEAGRMDFRPVKLPIRQVLDSMLYLASAQAQEKEIKLLVELLNRECEVFADEKMLSEVILNLIANAIKYSPKKTQVRLRIEEDTNMVNITVIDNGFGISPQHINHIFEKFYRIKDDPRVQEERGTGLGLALVKEVVELHRGKITVESQPGKGSTFKVSLPRKKMTTAWQP